VRTLIIASPNTVSCEFVYLLNIGQMPLNPHCDTITIARTVAKALLCVVLLVSARSLSLAPSSTPFHLSTLTIRSFNDSLLEETSTNLDLTCFTKPLSFWFKALKENLSINSIYSLIFMLVILGYTLYYVVLNFGIYPCMC